MFKSKTTNPGKLEKCRIDQGKLELEATTFGKLKVEIDAKNGLYSIETENINITYDNGEFSINSKASQEKGILAESPLGKDKLKP